MEEREREEGSSSQNVNKSVSSIRERGTCVEIILSDSSSFFILPDDFQELEEVSGCRILPGTPAERLPADKLVYLDCVCRAFEKGVSLLAGYPSSAEMLRLKLLKKGFEREASGEAVKKLIEKRMLDDRRFAENWVISRLRRNPEAPAALKASLMRKGISGSIADEVLRDMTPESQDYIEAFERAFEKQMRKSGITPDKMRAYLSRKGYPLSLINRYLRNTERFGEKNS